MGRIGGGYCMNLFEFLENLHPNTSIIVVTDDNEIFRGLIKDSSLELLIKYWVKEGMVRNARDGMVISVEHEDIIKKRLNELNNIDFHDILQKIMNEVQKSELIKEAFDSMIRSANYYCYYRKNWSQFSVDSLGQRNKERFMSHDIFIADINSLSDLVEKITGNSFVPWRVALGNDRHILGDFAEYVIDSRKKKAENFEILEAIHWAQEHQNQVCHMIEHSRDDFNVRRQLINQFEFSEHQARTIINMRLNGFSVEEREKISKELQECRDWLKCFPEIK